jgi:transcriptional regulator GlxA family with amidase domain
VGFAVDAIERTHGRLSIDALADAAGLTCRHLERRFLSAVGVTPKRLARIARFQHALRILGRESARPGTETAAACGYADQSHFIRDFRAIAGCSPGEHLLRRGELTGFFIEPR